MVDKADGGNGQGRSLRRSIPIGCASTMRPDMDADARPVALDRLLSAEAEYSPGTQKPSPDARQGAEDGPDCHFTDYRELLSRTVYPECREAPETEPTPSQALTGRQKSVIRMLACGQTSKEIASELGISPATVKCHVRAAVERLQARNRSHAIAILVVEDMGRFQHCRLVLGWNELAHKSQV
ncbi:LuxR C-terminal-related transcriptional regulator [uncultured Roseibium sp.]|uniref:helix-turn-helix domain-containing protein n=1 Tax=uncultured Roseibium sp. TaxID=1936171 RepID=UPI00321807BF